MLNADEDALICDLAQTYGIFNWRSLPVSTVATFACGLGANSRIKRKLTNEEYTTEEILLMNICDFLAILCWQNTKDGQKGVNKPRLYADRLSKKDTKSFGSIEEFELTRQAIMRGEE